MWLRTPGKSLPSASAPPWVTPSLRRHPPLSAELSIHHKTNIFVRI